MIKPLNNIFKKKIKQVEKKNVSDLINIEDIKGEVLSTKDGYIFSYIKVQPISIDLMTESEKKQITNKLTSEISCLRIPFKFLFISRKADIKMLISHYEEIKGNTVNTIKRDNLTKTIRYLSHISMGGGVLERQSYVCLWQKKSMEKELTSMAYDFKNSLQRCGYISHICGEYDIRTLCNLFLNPITYDTEVGDLYTTIPVI
ncbi:MAG: hypothetical protein KFW09_04925 [Oscillospiraceae bacterium]|nr:hypothetical protein [Oscillospiraceae bacterium]